MENFSREKESYWQKEDEKSEIPKTMEERLKKMKDLDGNNCLAEVATQIAGEKAKKIVEEG